MNKMIFLNIGWMSKYQGLKGDPISSGAKFVAEHGYGHELLNFLPHRGKMYGHATLRGGIGLERLGGLKDSESVNGVLVIWVARSLIIGWYKNATVYRHLQPPVDKTRYYHGHRIRYCVTADPKDCHLFESDMRCVPVPRPTEREHAMGRYSWFAEGNENSAFRAKVIKYVESGGKPPFPPKKKPAKFGHGFKQVDPLKKARIEEAAIKLVTRRFEERGYVVQSVEKDNVGWDLDAWNSLTGMTLKLEVKGLSGDAIQVDLTPNEYKMMGKHKNVYRLCVATRCIEPKQTKLAVFSYRTDSGRWVDDDERPLQTQVVKSARMRL